MAGRVGALTALAVAALVLAPLAVIARAAGPGAGLAAADLAALRFTLLQAALSAGASVLLAVPVARALARRRFAGRGALIAVMGAPFLLPVIVAVLGLLTVFGRGGWLNAGLALAGLGPVSIYGLHGVVLAHVFFNLPLAVRLILQGWQSVPAERYRLAASLGAGPAEIARLIEWPMLRTVLPGAALAIFLICLTSFAVALTLGGGPRATTLELAIYQAFRFDFDPARAALLSALQAGLCAVAVALSARVPLPEAGAGGLSRPAAATIAGGGVLLRLQDALAVALAGAFLLLPLAAILADGLAHILGLPALVWQAAARSALVALGAAPMAVAAALALAAGSLRRSWIEAAGMLPLAVSPLVFGTGVFLLVNPVADPAVVALPVTALANALAALPFALRVLLPELRLIEARQGRLADSLGLTGFARLRLLLLPRLARPLGFALGLSAALSAGDLGVIALFSAPGGETLPLALFRLMGSYRMDDAAGAAVLLLALSLGLFLIFDRGGRDAAV